MRCFSGLYCLLYNTLFLAAFVHTQTTNQHCSRTGSRLVRQVLDKYVYPVIENYGVNVSLDCPLRKSRDLYLIQEQQKTFEHNARWSCEVCGKSFYTQDYIDHHMEKKHGDLLVKYEDSPICLADYCQLFRCEAIENSRRKDHFWGKALCNKENMRNLKKKCLSLFQSCLLDMGMTGFDKQAYDEIIEDTCFLINCKDYWQPLDYELSSLEVLYYIVLTPILISALSVYYFNAWEYYFGDDAVEEKHKTNHTRSLSNDKQDLPGLRNRFTTARFEY